MSQEVDKRKGTACAVPIDDKQAQNYRDKNTQDDPESFYVNSMSIFISQKWSDLGEPSVCLEMNPEQLTS